MTKVTQDMINRFKADTSPEAQALRDGGVPELKRQVEAEVTRLEEVQAPVSQLKRKYGNLTRKRPTKIAMAVGFAVPCMRQGQ